MKNKGKLSSRILAALWMTGTISLTTTAQELRQIWHQEHSTTLSGYGRAIAFDADNNVFQLWSAGTNIALVKYSGGGGAILWQKHLAADVWQVPIDAEGNPLVFGRDEDLDNDGTIISEFYSAKLEGASGAVLWEKRYRDENGAALFVNNFDLDSSGNLVAMGSAVTSTNHTTLVIKYSGVNGDILWQERFSPTAAQDVGAMAVSTNGDVAVVRATEPRSMSAN